MPDLPPAPPTLLRALGPWSAAALVVGATIGAGVFKKPQAVAESVASFDLAILAWALCGVLALCGALALAELAGMLPKAGGNAVYLTAGFGPLWGFLWGWVEFWVTRPASAAALATLLAEALGRALLGTEPPDLLTRGGAAAVIVGLGAINVFGVRWGGLVQNVTTAVKFGAVIAVSALPFVLARADFGLLTQPGPPPEKGIMVGFGAALLAVLWAYKGWSDVGPLAEEVKAPERNLPRALLLGVGTVMAVYLAANVAYAVVLSQGEMAHERMVAVAAVERTLAPWGSGIAAGAGAAVAAAVMVSAFGALNSTVMAGSRTYFALARDGLFPRRLAAIHPRWRTPVAAIVAQTAWSVALLAGTDLLRDRTGADPFETLTNYAMFGVIIFETLAVAAVFALRRSAPDLPRPYRCWGYPWTPALHVAVMALVAVNTAYDQPVKSAVGLAFMVAGAGVYAAFFRRHAPITCRRSPTAP